MPRKTQSRKKQAGFIVSIELLLLASITVIGLIVGMTNVRDAVLAELSDVSESLGALDQSYNVSSVANLGGTAATAGSAFQDMSDSNAGKPIDTQSGNADTELVFAPAVPFNPSTTGSGEVAAPPLQ
ncbi:MAG: hypothetical protein QOK37_941 [Thermoanaerobaculia bacterium]|jgi:hypothetical protein|nr:hypothetical protein [Thermoanaerobaculia bacterium]